MAFNFDKGLCDFYIRICHGILNDELILFLCCELFHYFWTDMFALFF